MIRSDNTLLHHKAVTFNKQYHVSFSWAAFVNIYHYKTINLNVISLCPGLYSNKASGSKDANIDGQRKSDFGF